MVIDILKREAEEDAKDKRGKSIHEGIHQTK